MSTTQPASDRSTGSSPTPLERFDTLLFENPEVCSHCYTKIRDHETHDLDRLGNGNKPTETLQRAGGGAIGQKVTQKDEYGVKKQYTARTFCSACGSQSGRADGAHIASTQQLRRWCDNIVRRLHDQGYYPDVGTLYGTAVTLKQKPDHQGKDREILATAVYMALDRGAEATIQGRPTVTQPDPASE